MALVLVVDVVVVDVVVLDVVVGAGSMHSAVHCAPAPDFFLLVVKVTVKPFLFPFLPLITWLILLDPQYLEIHMVRKLF